MHTHLLDTSVYSQRLRPQPLASVVAHWQDRGDHSLAISSLCEAELLYGLAKKNSPRLWKEYREYLENRLVILPMDKSVAHLFGNLKAEMESRGTPRADFDLLIAATAIHHGLIFATLNIRHFVGIPRLVCEDWRKLA